MKWFTLCGVLVMACGCQEKPSDEQALRAAISAMESAAEDRQIKPILDYLAKDFRGNDHYRKANIGGMLLLHYRQNRHVHVYLRIDELLVKGDTASIRCQVVLTGRDKKPLPERARVMVINSDWQRVDGEWRVVRASWRDPLLQP